MVANSKVPDVYSNSFSVQSQGTQGAEVTTESVAQTDVTLNVNTHSYIALLFGDKDIQQVGSMYDINAIYTRKIAGQLRQDFEDALFGEWSNISTNTVGDTATVLSDADIRQGVNKLLQTDYPMDELAFFFHPFTYMVQLLAIQKYYDVSQFSKNGTAVGATLTGSLTGRGLQDRMTGQLYNIPVMLSSRVVAGLQTHRNMLLHREAFAFASQTPGDSMIRVQSEKRLENIGMLTVADHIYGVKTLREEGAVLLNANSSFVQS